MLCGCLTKGGHDVVGVDVQEAKVEAINHGVSPILEQGLGPLLERAVASGKLQATLNASEALRLSDLSLICVGTPSTQSGGVDLRALKRVCTDIGRALRNIDHFHSVLIRSTVLPGTTKSVAIPIIEQESGKRVRQDFGAGYNPEFMREGNAIADFFSPSFNVIAALDPVTLGRLKELYEQIHAPTVELPLESAELLKSVCNGFHAMKVAFANEIGSLCSAMGLDGAQLMEAFCQDTKLNVSPRYLRPGFAFGGSCLPKDLRALGRVAESRGIHVPLLKGILESNEAHIRRAEDLIIATGKTRIGMLGLTFKSGTDDTRESPALVITQALLQKGYDVWAYEPDLDTDRLHGVNREYICASFPDFESRLVGSTRELAQCADVLVITKSDIRFAQLQADLSPEHVVIDLVGFFPKPTLPAP